MKKFLPHILILVFALSGLVFVQSSETQAAGRCVLIFDDGTSRSETTENETACIDLAQRQGAGTWQFFGENSNIDNPTPTVSTPVTTSTPTPTEKPTNAFQSYVDKCSYTDLRCWILYFLYYIWFTVPAFLLYLTAYLFNASLAITLSSKLYSASSFIDEAWRIVRDFSNIFFIFILLYAAVKMILGLIGADIKKTAAYVVIMALLINFSMFATQVVIDSSNILALIFYNKISVSVTKDGQGCKTADGKDANCYWSATKASEIGVEEKNISGAIAESFNPTNFVNPQTIPTEQQSLSWTQTLIIGATAVINPAAGVGLYFLSGAQNSVPTTIAIAILVVSGIIMALAAWAFFFAALAFLGRLIELWVLIIFSPFAFMSFAMPQLKKVKYLGWDSWVDRLIATAFMAPIFMFFMLVISKIIQADPFGKIRNVTEGAAGTAGDLSRAADMILITIIPAIISIVLLFKALKFAKEGGGEFSGAVIKAGTVAAGVVGGLALTAASGGTSMVLGRAGSAVANSGALKAREAQGGFGGWAAGKFRDLGKYAGKSSFDIRGIKIAGKDISSATGINFGKAKEGGWEKRRAEQVKKRQERAKELEVSEDEHLKQDLNHLEEEKQNLLRSVSHDIEQIDNQLKVWRERAADTARAARLNAGGDSGLRDAAGVMLNNGDANRLAENNLARLRARRNAIKNTRGADAPVLTAAATAARAAATAAPGNAALAAAAREAQTLANIATLSARGSGMSINQLEDEAIPHAHHAIEIENRNRKWNYAASFSRGASRALNTIFRLGNYSMYRGVNEAVHKIRMEAKLDDKGGGGHH